MQIQPITSPYFSHHAMVPFSVVNLMGSKGDMCVQMLPHNFSFVVFLIAVSVRDQWKTTMCLVLKLFKFRVISYALLGTLS